MNSSNLPFLTDLAILSVSPPIPPVFFVSSLLAYFAYAYDPPQRASSESSTTVVLYSVVFYRNSLSPLILSTGCSCINSDSVRSRFYASSAYDDSKAGGTMQAMSRRTGGRR